MAKGETGRVFFGALESWRGVAALIVAWFHAPFVDGDKLMIVKQGAIFVDFFFVLSGFVIAHAYLDKIRAGLGFQKFALLRLARLYPLHLFMLAVWVPFVLVRLGVFEVYGIGADPTERNNVASFGLNLILLHSMGFLETLTWNGPAWSISVEFFTYLMFFLLTWAFRAHAALVFVLVAAASLVAIYVLAKMGGEHGILFTTDFGILRCFASFFTGAALYIGFRSKPWRLARAPATVLEAGVVFAVVFAVARSFNHPEWQLASIAGFGALIYIFASGGGYISTIMNARSIRYVGEISYSIYMVHAIIMIAVSNLCRFILKIDTIYLSGEYPLIQTSFAIPLNILLLLVVTAISALVYRWVELRGKAWMYRAFKLR